MNSTILFVALVHHYLLLVERTVLKCRLKPFFLIYFLKQYVLVIVYRFFGPIFFFFVQKSHTAMKKSIKKIGKKLVR